MFLFEPIPLQNVIAWFVVLAALILLNEVSRRNMFAGIAMFVVLPLILTFTVWMDTATGDSSVSTWFHWAKTYSVLAGAIGFMAIRYIKGAVNKSWVLFFPAFILGFNILEAVIREFQVYSFSGMNDGMIINGGGWNIFNAIAGILNIITICGWAGIFISNDKHKDMLWPDMLWFWIIAYDLWNFVYIYNCVPLHAYYAGGALLLACTIPAFLTRKGAWLQHRAHTLAFWMMFLMTFPNFVDHSEFAVGASYNTTANWTVSLISFAMNVAVFAYQIHRIRSRKLSPLRDELYTDHKGYIEVAKDKEGYAA